MRRWSLWLVALLTLSLVALQGAAQDAVKKDDPKTEKKDDPKTEKKDDPKPPVTPEKKPVVKTTVVTGEVASIKTGSQAIRLKVARPTLDEGAVREMATAQQEMARARNAQQLIQARQKLARAQARLYKMTTVEVDIEGTEDLKVRLSAPKSAFDDMGNIKTYTAKELAELRGPDKLFDGEFSDLAPGQVVQVTVIVPKPPAKPMNKDDIPLNDNKLEATKIVVAKTPGAPPGK
jgi:hypothetical protein